MNLKKPIVLSLVGLVSITVISIIIFSTWKPTFVTTVNNKKKKSLNWGKILSLSFVLGIVTAITLYISTMKPTLENVSTTPMKFRGPVADSY